MRSEVALRVLFSALAVFVFAGSLAMPAGDSVFPLPTPVRWTDGTATCYLSFSGSLQCFVAAGAGGETEPPPATTPSPTATPTATPTVTPAPTRSPSPTPVTAPTVTPTSARPPTPKPMTLTNPGFEDGLAGWTPFTLSAAKPLEVNAESLANGASRWVVREGDKSARIKGMYHCWDAGFYQVVQTTPGTRFRFSYYGMTWGRNSSDINLPSDPNLYSYLYAGVDPYGFTQAGNSRVQWQGRPGTDVIIDFPGVGEYAQPVWIESVALADRVTVFIRANLGAHPGGGCVWPYESMLAFFDSAWIAPADE